jgi:hypothetical protein
MFPRFSILPTTGAKPPAFQLLGTHAPPSKWCVAPTFQGGPPYRTKSDIWRNRDEYVDRPRSQAAGGSVASG